MARSAGTTPQEPSRLLSTRHLASSRLRFVAAGAVVTLACATGLVSASTVAVAIPSSSITVVPTEAAYATATYTVTFLAQNDLASAGDTITLVAPVGTAFSTSDGDYTISDGGPALATALAAPGGTDTVILDLPVDITLGDSVTVIATNVTNPTTPGADTVAVDDSEGGSQTVGPYTIHAAADATNSTLSGTSATLVADGSDSEVITLQEVDGSMADITTGGDVVTMSATVGSLNAVTDNTDGTYSATLTSSTVAGAGNVTASINGVPITSDFAVALVAGTADATTTTISAATSPITADGVTTSVITVQAKDANGNNLTSGGATVLLATDLGTLSGVSDVGDGTYTATLTSGTTAGTATISGTLNGVGNAITDTATVDFSAGAAVVGTTTISAATSPITADGVTTSLITVQAEDVHGNALAVGGATVTLATTLGTLGSVTDHANGTYTATLTSATTAGTATISGTLNGVGNAITDTAAVVFTAGAAVAATTTISAAPTSVVANGTSASTITVHAKDANGNPLSVGGDIVTIGVALNSLGSVSGVTDVGDGTYTALVTSTTTGDATVVATMNGTTIPGTATVTFIPGVADAGLTTISAASSPITADGVSTSVITVQAEDAHGNDLTAGGDTVTLATTAGTLSTPVFDNTDGTYTATLTSATIAGTATISGFINTNAITDTATVVFSAGAAVVGTTTISAATSPITADGVTTSLITVQAEDVHGNALAVGGATVTLATTLGTLGSVTDHANGTYTATLTSATTAGTATISGTLNGVGNAITDTAAVVFSAGAAVVGTTTISAATSPITANGVATSVITVQTEDVHGNALAVGGATVTLATTLGTLGSVTDHANGTYTATLTSATTAGTATVSGTLNGVGNPITDTAAVVFSAGAAVVGTTTISAASSPITADGVTTSQITVQTEDVHGNPLAIGGDTVVLSTNLGTIGSVTDHANGTYTATLTSATTAGTATVTGTLNGVGNPITDTAAVVFTAGAAAAATTTISAASSPITADGVTTSLITVQTEDVHGNALAVGGATVTLATTLGTLGSVTDHANGTYTATLTSATTAGTATISGTLNGVGNPITHTAVVTFAPGAASAAQTTMTATPTTIVANGVAISTITVHSKDIHANALATGGAAVTILTNLGTVSGVTDHSDGTYTATLTGSTAGTATVTGTLGGLAIANTSAITLTAVAAGVADPSFTTITRSPASIVADGATASTITVHAFDGTDTALTTGGDAVTVATNLGTLSSVTDHNNGTYTATLTGIVTGTATIHGTINTATITTTAPTVALTPGLLNLAHTVISAGTTSIVADGVTTSLITVQAKDANGNNLTTGGSTIGLTPTLGTIGTVTDGANGTYTATLTSATVTGTSTITGTVGGSAITTTPPTVTFTAGASSPAHALITVGASSIVANGVATSAITVQTRDVHNNNVGISGGVVTLTTTLGTLASPTATNNNNGTYSDVLTSGMITGIATISGTMAAATITTASPAVAFTAVVSSGGTGAAPPTVPASPVRLSGSDRFGTAVAASLVEFPVAGTAGAVVLARSDDYPDALVGTALAAAKNAPLLFANGGELTLATQAEIQRVLPAGGTVYLLGGTAAIPASVATSLTSLGFVPVRYAGTDRFGTALAVADALDDPSTVLLATGINFPDALAAGPAAAHLHGVVLLTNGSSLTPAVAAYLAAHPGTVYAIGGPAVAADPSATALSGADRYATAAAVASMLFTAPANVGVASGTAFPDALSGGAFQAHFGGPLVLTDPHNLPAATGTYLTGADSTIVTTNVFGGDSALSPTVQTAVATALGL